MDILLLGMLMLKKCTIYEMRKIIERNFTSISSNSMGSIQTALKKLRQSGRVIFSEGVENGVNKKIYEITEAGRSYFLAEIAKPMRNKEKNMELVRFFYMGFAPTEERGALLGGYIAELRSEMDFLEQLRRTIEAQPPLDAEGIAKMGITPRLSAAAVREIAVFQRAMLQFSIDKLAFETRWFADFREEIDTL